MSEGSLRLPPGPAFTFSAPVLSDRSVRVLFGPGTLHQVAAEAMRLGSRIVLISGRHERDAATAVSRQLGRAVVDRTGEVTPHVTVEAARAAVAQARGVGAETLVAIGGGSATGLAKAVARETGLPIVAVPTTYAGSEMTAIWGLSEGGVKTTGRDPRVLPEVVVYDPLLTLSLPPQISAASGLNALAHAVESLYAPDRTAWSSRVAQEAIRALAQALPRVVRRPDDVEVRTAALRGAWLGGWALGSTTMGLHHKLAHVIGGRHRLWHAGLHSVLLPQVAAFTAPAAPEAFQEAARALGESRGAQVPAALRSLAETTGAPTALSDLGLPEEAIREIAEVAANAPLRHPRAASEQELYDLVQLAYQGHPPPRWPPPGPGSEQEGVAEDD